MAAGVTVKDDSTKLFKLLGRLLNKGALSVGILAEDAAKTHEAKEATTRIADIFKGFDSEGKGKSTAITIGEIAAIHEFGLGSVPQRSFLQGWADENKALIDDTTMKGARALAAGRLTSALQFMNQLGAWAVGQVQLRMAQNIPPPLSPITIMRKGSSIALIDTGQLRSSISFRVDTVQVLKAGISYGPGPEVHNDGVGVDFGAGGGVGAGNAHASRDWQKGPRGGQFYITASGRKVYRSWELVKK